MATRAASRLAAALAARDLPAAARGRLAWLTLPDDPDAAATAVRRASALVAGPFVTGLAGPRPPELETLIAEHDIAIVSAPPDAPLARAAVAALADRGIPALATEPLRRGAAARTLALAGITAHRLAVPDDVVEAGREAVAAESSAPTVLAARRSESIWTDR